MTPAEADEAQRREAGAVRLLHRKLTVFTKDYLKRHPGYEISDLDLGTLIFLRFFNWNDHCTAFRGSQRPPEFIAAVPGEPANAAEFVLFKFWKHRDFATGLFAKLQGISNSVDILDVYLATKDPEDLREMPPGRIIERMKMQFGEEAVKVFLKKKRPEKRIDQRRKRYLESFPGVEQNMP